MPSIVQSIKRGIIDAEGSQKVSQVHITNLKTEEIIQLSMTPEAIKVTSGASFRSYSIIERGEVKLPKGEELTTINWRGIFPHAGILMYPFVNHAVWERPEEIIRALNRWRSSGDKLKLLITETPINHEFYLKDFDPEFSGGFGNVTYTINFIAAKELKILTVEEADAQRQAAQDNLDFELKRRAAMKSRAGVECAKWQNMWEIALFLTGNGGDWQRIMERNGLSDPFEFEPTTWVMNL